MSADDEVRRLANEGLSSLGGGERLAKAVENAIQIALIKGHVAEEVWLRLQLIDLPNEEKPTGLPAEIERLWRAIDASKLVEVPREIRIGTMQDHFNSRTPSRTPEKLFTKHIDSLEDIYRNCQILEADGRPVPTELFLACRDAREVYERVWTRVRGYLGRHAGEDEE
jgi:hypothetical protein